MVDDKENVEAEIAAILAPRWVSRVITTTLTGESPAKLRLGVRMNTKAWAALEEKIFGNWILFSDKVIEQASTATIVAEYRSQKTVEADFRQIKDPKVLSFSPMFNWTEQKIRVHVFHCVVALMIVWLMVREVDRAGMRLTVRAMLSSLASIEDTVLLYQADTRHPRARRMFTDMDPEARRLY